MRKFKILLLCLVVTLIMSSIFSVQATSTDLNVSKSSQQYLLGDVTGDNKVTIRDATLIQMYLAGIENFNAKQKFLADVNENNKVDIRDVTVIQLYKVGYSFTSRINTYVDLPASATEPSTGNDDWLPGFFD